jgi:hypothetical protein
MDALMKLSREVQVVLGGAVLYVIFSFFDWQQVSAGPFTYGRSEWSGIGVIAALLAIVLVVWEIGRMIEFKIELGSLTPGLISIGLALLLLLFTVITFLSHSAARHWPAWIGLLLSIVIAVAAFKRAQGEGVEMPKNIAIGGAGGSGSTTTSSPPPPPPAAPSSEPAPSSDQTADA